jgi:hypothetical protein
MALTDTEIKRAKSSEKPYERFRTWRSHPLAGDAVDIYVYDPIGEGTLKLEFMGGQL